MKSLHKQIIEEFPTVEIERKIEEAEEINVKIVETLNEIDSVNPEASLAWNKGKPSVSCESSISCESSVSHNHESRLVIKALFHDPDCMMATKML